MHTCLGSRWMTTQPESVAYPSHLSNRSLLVSLGAMAAATAATPSTAELVVYIRLGPDRARAAFGFMGGERGIRAYICQTRKDWRRR